MGVRAAHRRLRLKLDMATFPSTAFELGVDGLHGSSCEYHRMITAKAAISLQLLVGGLVAMFYFPMTIGNVLIPIDELIFFRGVTRSNLTVVS